MMVSSKRAGERGVAPIDALYVHYSPPRLVDARRWARGGDVERLRDAALGGHAHRLLGLAAPGVRTRSFLKDLPNLIAKCDALHAAVTEGSLKELKDILDADPMRKRLALCRDRAGVGLLHKAVYYDYRDIINYLLENYPQTVFMRDSEGRTPLHYTAVCSDPNAVSEQLLKAGAERAPVDSRQRNPAYYITRPTALRLPEPTPPTPQQSDLVIKPANIRIWCHDRDLGRLQQVVWRGQGARLRTEVSSQPAVRRFLEAVPHIMGTIKEMHSAVVQNDLAKLKSVTEEPIPPIIFSSQDSNGLTPLHKAAGLGHHEVADYILSRYPEGTLTTDNDGRTPLHWSILAKDSDRLYNRLLEHGAEEGKLDNKLKSAAFYRNRPTDIDKSLLNAVPEAPRVASATYPASWDWNLLKADIQTAPTNSRTKKSPDPADDKPVSEPAIGDTQSISENDIADVQSIEADTHESLMEPHTDHDDHSHGHEEHEEREEHFETEENDDNELENSEVENEHKVSETTFDEQEHDEGESNDNVDENNSKSPENETNITTDSVPDVEDPSSPSPTHAQSTYKKSTKTPGTAPVNKRTPSDSPDSATDTNNRISKTATVHKNYDINRNTKTPDSINDSNPPSPRKEDENATSDYEDDDNADNESQSPREDKSLENDFNAPHIQDIDDEKGDEPDLERLDVTRGESRTRGESNDEDNEDDDETNTQESASEYGDAHKADTADVLDVENMKRNHSAKGRSSQGSESTIEGVINADPEVDSLDADHRENGNSPHEADANIEDAEIQMLIDSGNMEQLAALVLNGEGERLVGHMARNPELQAFLDNVPSYMNKIKRVHLSAREGALRELQAALDRRKFAVARDQVSPGGATPLHVAVLFGHTPVLRYLAGRFPETLSAVDFEGRTALHYAAVLKDNGHYYNILLNMGANHKDQDDNGYTPEDYQKSDKFLTHKQLLKEFGAEESLADEMLNDKVSNDIVSARRELSDPDMQSVLWRCFRLLQDHRRPSRVGAPPSASSNQGPPTTFLGRFLTRPVFEKIRGRITKLDHNLFDVIWPAVKKLPDDKGTIESVEEDFNGGIVAPDYYAYAVYEEFTMPLIKDLHCINMYSDLQDHPESLFLPKPDDKESNQTNTGPAFLDIHLDLDPSTKYILAGTIECSRNLEEFELPLNLNVGQLEIVERNLTNILLSDEFANVLRNSDSEEINSDEKGGVYYTMNEVLDTPSEIRAILAASGLLIPLSDTKELDDDKRLHGKHWPYGRGVFLSHDGNIAIWLNVQDHVRVLSCTSHQRSAEIGRAYSAICRVMMHLNDNLNYRADTKLGYLSARPSFLGNSLRFTLTLNLPYLSKDPDNLKHLCTVRGLNHRETHQPEIVRIGNYQSLGVTELQTFHDFTTAMGNILQLEKDLAMQNSIHIAEMFVNIFRRKKNSLVDTNI